MKFARRAIAALILAIPVSAAAQPPALQPIEASLPPALPWSGASERQALAAATSRTAEFFGTNDRGRVVVGKRADLLLLDGPP